MRFLKEHLLSALLLMLIGAVIFIWWALGILLEVNFYFCLGSVVAMGICVYFLYSEMLKIIWRVI